MTTLAVDTPRRFTPFGTDVDAFGVIASDTIYEGSAVGDNGSGYGRPLVSADPFRGFALQKADNSAGAAGALNVKVQTRGQIRLAITSLGITDVGRPVYAADDNTFALTGLGTYIGRVVRYESTGVGIVAFDVMSPERELIVPIALTLANLADGDVVTAYTPGFPGRIKALDFAVLVAVTTAAKLSTLNAEINTTNVTGGAVALTSANCTPIGKVVAGSAVSAANAFDINDTISIEAASTTTFVEGSGVLLVKLGY